MGVFQVGMPWPWALVDEANSSLVPVPAETVPATLVPAKTVPAMPAQPSEAASMEHAPAETVPAMPARPRVADSVEHAPAKALQPGATDIVLPGHLAAAFAEFCKANPGGTQFVQAPA